MAILPGGTRVHTRSLTTALTITNGENKPPVLRATLIVESGTCTVLGNFDYDGVASSAISLSTGQVDTIFANGPNAGLDGITITPVGGTTNIQLAF